MKNIYKINFLILSGLLFFFNACKEEEYAIPAPKETLQNDVIKRSLGPNLVGQRIEFAYAMAILPTKGKLTSAEVSASIQGATGTFLENRTFFTNGSGQDVGRIVGTPSVNEGNITKVGFTRDTSASTLRYYYVIPEAARGQAVSFTFSASSSNGENISYQMGPYNISRMDMKLDLDVRDAQASFISIEDMAVYTATEAATRPEKIDLVYLHRTAPASFAHALVSPATDPIYRPGITLPAGINRNTKISKAWAIRDQQLARLQFGVFIDDLDFQQINLADAPNFALNMRAESGAWVETVDGKYRAYIYVNSINNTTKSARISIKRYTL